MIFRSLLLLVPLSLWALFVIHPRWTSRDVTATFLGFAWAFHATLITGILMLNTNILVFSIHDTLFYGVPLDWVFSQSIIIGALVPLTRLWQWNSVSRVLIQTLAVAVIYGYTDFARVGFVQVESLFPWVVILVTSITAIPAMFLSDWTANDSHIGKRATLQAIAWAALLFWLFPSVIFSLTSETWSVFLQREITNTLIYLIPMILPAYLLISALYYFAVEGDGTAFPYDPPKHLVTHGVYQYISNPMQVGISFGVGWWGVVIQSLWVSISAVFAVILFVVFKDVCNGSCAIGVDNPEWEAYQNTVPKWWPRMPKKN